MQMKYRNTITMIEYHEHQDRIHELPCAWITFHERHTYT